MNINLELLSFDYLVIFIAAIFIVFGFWKGFINSVLGLLTWVGSVFITIYTYEYLSDYLSNLLLNINFLSKSKISRLCDAILYINFRNNKLVCNVFDRRWRIIISF